MCTKKKRNGRFSVTVIENETDVLTLSDAEMNNRAKAAVKAAIDKAKLCKKPVAKYDSASGRAYVEYASGEKKYV